MALGESVTDGAYACGRCSSNAVVADTVSSCVRSYLCLSCGVGTAVRENTVVLMESEDESEMVVVGVTVTIGISIHRRCD